MSKKANIIRKMEPSEIDAVLNIWLEAAMQAHSFVDREFWESNIDIMREKYIPNSDTYVYIENYVIKGFFSLCDTTLAAIFVAPAFQSQRIGRQLIKKAKSLRDNLNLTVYKENTRSIDFYLKSGFSIIGERPDKHTGHTELLMKFCS